MAQVIAVVNQKGGVSKSTTAQIIGNALTLKGKSVLFVDLDAQGNLTYALGNPQQSITAYEVLAERRGIERGITSTEQGDLLPASPLLSTLDAALTGKQKRAERLRMALQPVRGIYQYIILDTPPALGDAVINALTAADEVVIPVKADVFSLQGLGALRETLEGIKASTNPGLQISGVLLQQYNSRTVLSRQITDMVDDAAKQLGTKVFNATIRDATAIREAQALQTNVVDYVKHAKVHDDIEQFMGEFIPGYSKF